MILSVQNSEADIVSALDNGATDYLVKPFRTAELLARIRFAIRRNQPQGSNSIIECGNLQIDLAARTARKNNEIVKLTSTEFNLLSLFARNEGRVLTHHYILKEIWGLGYQTETQYLRVFVDHSAERSRTIQTSPAYYYRERCWLPLI